MNETELMLRRWNSKLDFSQLNTDVLDKVIDKIGGVNGKESK